MTPRISRARAFRILYPFEKPLLSSGRAALDGFDAVVVALQASDGTVGWGEMAPLGSFYSPAFAAGARAGVAELLPLALGASPLALGELQLRLDRNLNGHPYVKAAIDMACHDLAARVLGVPLYDLLGGLHNRASPLYASVMDGPADRMAAEASNLSAGGLGRFQVKLRGDPIAAAEKLIAVSAAIPKGAALFADANGSWTTADALRFASAAREVDFIFEQPCRTLHECLAVRRRVSMPIALDESVTCLGDIAEIHRAQAADVVTLKLSRVGGIGPARLIRDAAAELGLMVTIEDTGGAELVMAAVAHLASSMREDRRLQVSSLTSWITRGISERGPEIVDHRLLCSPSAGLGVKVAEDVLGDPFIDIRD